MVLSCIWEILQKNGISVHMGIPGKKCKVRLYGIFPAKRGIGNKRTKKGMPGAKNIPGLRRSGTHGYYYYSPYIIVSILFVEAENVFAKIRVHLQAHRA